MIRASLRLLKRHADAFLLWMAVVIGGTLFLMFWGAVRWSTTELWRQEWQGVHVQVFCVPESVVAVSETLRRAEGIAAVSVVLPAQGWQEVQQQLGLPELEGADTLLPAVCVATLSERIQLEDVLALQKQMEQRVGVSAVVFPMERVSELLRRRQREALWWYGGAVFGALLWLSTAVGAMRRIRHRAATYAVMAVLGVPPWRLRVPFLLGSWGAATIGVLVAVGGAIALCTVFPEVGDWFLWHRLLKAVSEGLWVELSIGAVLWWGFLVLVDALLSVPWSGSQ